MDVLNNKAIVLINTGSYDEALTTLNEVLSRDPKFVSALANKANVLSLMGRHDEALACIDEAIEISGSAQRLSDLKIK